MQHAGLIDHRRRQVDAGDMAGHSGEGASQ
jgi:hypothetical protein